MSDNAILVLNAGSSSIKFLLFAERDGELDPVVRGQIEGIQTAPRFIARDARFFTFDSMIVAALAIAGQADRLCTPVRDGPKSGHSPMLKHPPSSPPPQSTFAAAVPRSAVLFDNRETGRSPMHSRSG